MFFAGDFTLITPASLLQLLCQEQRSVAITAQRGDESACIQIIEGMIVRAQCGASNGREAMYRWLVWDGGSFYVNVLHEAPAEVDMMAHYEELVLEAARRRDELELTLTPVLPYPQRSQLEQILVQCPALAGIALVSSEGRLLGALGLDHVLTLEAQSVVAGLAIVGGLLAAPPQQIALYITSNYRLLLVQWGRVWLLAVPTSGASVSEATAQIQKLPIDYL